MMEPHLNIDLLQQLIAWLPRAGSSLLVFLLFWIAARVMQSILLKIFTGVDNNRKLIVTMLAKLVKVIIILLGAITALSSMGVDTSALVASLGLSGFALSFAMKDTLSNILAGVIIIIYQPFKTGDIIDAAGSSGKVSKIDLRYTCLESDNKQILIPNSMLLTKVVAIKN